MYVHALCPQVDLGPELVHPGSSGLQNLSLQVSCTCWSHTVNDFLKWIFGGCICSIVIDRIAPNCSCTCGDTNMIDTSVLAKLFGGQSSILGETWSQVRHTLRIQYIMIAIVLSKLVGSLAHVKTLLDMLWSIIAYMQRAHINIYAHVHIHDGTYSHSVAARPCQSAEYPGHAQQHTYIYIFFF